MLLPAPEGPVMKTNSPRSTDEVHAAQNRLVAAVRLVDRLERQDGAPSGPCVETLTGAERGTKGRGGTHHDRLVPGTGTGRTTFRGSKVAEDLRAPIERDPTVERAAGRARERAAREVTHALAVGAERHRRTVSTVFAHTSHVSGRLGRIRESRWAGMVDGRIATIRDACHRSKRPRRSCGSRTSGCRSPLSCSSPTDTRSPRPCSAGRTRPEATPQAEAWTRARRLARRRLGLRHRAARPRSSARPRRQLVLDDEAFDGRGPGSATRRHRRAPVALAAASRPGPVLRRDRPGRRRDRRHRAPDRGGLRHRRDARRRPGPHRSRVERVATRPTTGRPVAAAASRCGGTHGARRTGAR